MKRSKHITALTALAVIIILGALLLRLTQSTNDIETPTPSPTLIDEIVDDNEVSFQAPDLYRLSGSFYPPSQEDGPIIILIHQFGSNRSDYEDFVPLLQESGYGVLAYDIRGFGKSRNGNAEIEDFPLDTDGAITFIREGGHNGLIGLVGASIGANTAYVASSNEEVTATVLLSPSNTSARGILTGEDIEGFEPSNFFIASDEREEEDADYLFEMIGDPKEQKVYEGFGHGVSLLRSEEAIEDILEFLDSNLKEETVIQ